MSGTGGGVFDAPTEPQFVGGQRAELVDRLLALFDQVVEERSPHWVAIEAPTGWGKSRIVHEFYKRLAAERQHDGAYWSPSIGDAEQSTSARRKRVTPLHAIQSSAKPSFMWWGIECGDLNGAPVDALAHRLKQFEDVKDDIARRWESSPTARERVARAIRSRRGEMVEAGVGEVVAAGLAAVNLAVPGLGSLLSLMGKWGVESVRSARAEDGDGEEPTPFEVAVASEIGILARDVLPVVVFVEDLQHSDRDLAACLAGLLEFPEARVLVITTAWTGDGDAVGRRRSDLVLRVDRGRRTTWGISSDADLELDALEESDVRRIVEAASTLPADVVQVLATRYTNPLAVQLACQAGTLRDAISEGLDAVAAAADLPVEVDDLYRDAFRTLPAPVQTACMLAALASPAGVRTRPGDWDTRWDLELVAGAAESVDWIRQKVPDLRAALGPGSGAYDWVREVETWLRRFHELGQLKVVRDRAMSTDLRSESHREQYFDALLSGMRFELGASDERILNHALLVIALEAEGFIEKSDVWRGAVVFYCDHLRGRRSIEASTEIVDLTTRFGLDSPEAGKEAFAPSVSANDDEALFVVRSLSGLGADDPVGGESAASEAALALVRQQFEDARGFMSDPRRAVELGIGQVSDEQFQVAATLFITRTEALVDLGHTDFAFDELVAAMLGFGPYLLERPRVPPRGALDTVWIKLVSCLAWAAGSAGRPALAVDLLSFVIESEEAAYGPGRPSTLSHRQNRARWRAHATGDMQGQFDELTALLPWIIEAYGVASRNAFVTRKNRAWAAGRLGRSEEARADLEELLRDMESSPNRFQDLEYMVRNALAAQTGYAGDAERAVELYRELSDELGTSADLLTAQVWWNRSYWHQQAGDVKRAANATSALLDCLRLRGPGCGGSMDLRAAGGWFVAKCALGQVHTGTDELVVELLRQAFEFQRLASREAVDLPLLGDPAEALEVLRDDQLDLSMVSEGTLLQLSATLHWVGQGDEASVSSANAEAFVRRAVELRDAAVTRSPDPSRFRPLSASLLQLGSLTGTHDLVGALALVERSLELRQRVCDLEPENQSARTELLNAMKWVGKTTHELGRKALTAADPLTAEIRFRRAVDMREQVADIDSSHGNLTGLAQSLQGLGVSLGRTGDAEGALQTHERSLEFFLGLEVNDVDSRRATDVLTAAGLVGSTSHELGVAAARACEWDVAAARLQRALEMRELVLAGDDVPQRQADSAQSLLERGVVWRRGFANNERALDLFRRARDLREDLQSRDPDDQANAKELLIATDWVGLAAHDLGVARARGSERDGAAEAFDAAVEAREVVAAREPTARRFNELGASLLELGIARLRSGDTVRARRRFDESGHWFEQAVALDPSDEAMAKNLANVTTWLQECDRAEDEGVEGSA